MPRSSEVTVAVRVALNILRAHNAPSEVLKLFQDMLGADQSHRDPQALINEQLKIMRAYLNEVATLETEIENDALLDAKIVKSSDLYRRFINYACFRHDPRGANEAFKAALATLETENIIQEASLDVLAPFNFNGKAYMVVVGSKPS